MRYAFHSKMSEDVRKWRFWAGIYLLKVNNRNTRTRWEICSELAIKTSQRRHWCRSGVFIVNFEHISRIFLVFLLLTLNMQLLAGQAAKKSNFLQVRVVHVERDIEIWRFADVSKRECRKKILTYQSKYFFVNYMAVTKVVIWDVSL